jgi:diguanylate cyclase (GGDEF)-like protein/PAS domain S-box-containing protein
MAAQISIAVTPASGKKLARKLADIRLQHRYHVLKMLSDDASLDSVLQAIIAYVESANPALCCSIRLADSNVSQVEDWPKNPCLWESIVSIQGQVLGIFVISSEQVGQPDASALEFMKYGAGLAALVIEKKMADAQLRLASSVFDHTREGIMITDVHGAILKVNKTFTTITGFDMLDALGNTPRMLRSPNQASELFPLMYQTLAANGQWTGEICNRHKNGTDFTSKMTISAITDAAGHTVNYVAMFSDITESSRHALQLKYIAHYDDLTGLPNRVLLADRLQQAIIQSDRFQRSVAVGFIDLDGFKAINDAWGHSTGDALLSVLALRMKAALREGDTLARIGGDEFVVVLVDMTLEQDYQVVMERLLQAASAPVQIGPQFLQVSASIGVTLYPADRSDPDLLMRHADQSMYQAKHLGRNRYHLFDVAEDVDIKTRQHSLLQIERALKNQELVLFYQPKINMRTQQLIGVEALIRWQHPERGLLHPVEFLPLIENHALSVTLGYWVIDTALAQMSQWQALGQHIPISVNVSARHLQHDFFVPQLQELLARYPLYQRDFLELELLETSALQDIVKVSGVLKACAAMGVRSALDDFGTGYSSLAHLKRLPSEVIKIDRHFVRDMLDDPDDLAIVKGIIGLAAAFRREVIAEGVETYAHASVLIELGCVQGQGFGIARPMPADSLPDWLVTWQQSALWQA